MKPDMAENRFSEPIVEKSRDLGQHALCCLLDALFLVAWFFINVKAGHLILEHEMAPADLVTFHQVQIIFKLMTLCPLAFFFLKDFCIIAIRSWGRVMEVWKEENAPPTSSDRIETQGGVK